MMGGSGIKSRASFFIERDLIMLNLRDIKQKNYEIVWFDGTKLELNTPSYALYKKAMQLSQMDSTDIGELLDTLYDVIFELFNNNIQNRSFSREEIETQFNIPTAIIFINDYITSINNSLGES